MQGSASMEGLGAGYPFFYWFIFALGTKGAWRMERIACRIVVFSLINLFFKFAVLHCPASLSMEVRE